jgi:biopolymer transport protein ExbD
MKIKREKQLRQPPRIEMIPLMDVIFLVLVVFIYSMLTMVVHRGIPVNLPQATTLQTDQKDYTSISLTPDGTIFFNKERCTLAELGFWLRERFSALKEKPVYINGDKDVAYGLVVEILDLVRSVGYTKVVIEAEQKKQS